MLIDNLITKIDLLCSQKHISINQMLKDCELNKSVIDNLKKGSVPSVDKINKIASYFNVSTDYLLNNDNIKVYDEHDNIVVIDDETRDIIDSLRTNPEMKILFSVSKKATKEDIIKAVKIIEALRNEE